MTPDFIIFSSAYQYGILGGEFDYCVSSTNPPSEAPSRSPAAIDFLDKNKIRDLTFACVITPYRFFDNYQESPLSDMSRTALIGRLMGLRRSYINEGGKLLNEQEFGDELLAMRGGLADE
jgi:hypothetical protein